MDDKQVLEQLAQSVPNITARLPELDRDTLVQLQAAEVKGANRTTLLAAIDERLKALDDAGEGGDQLSGSSTKTTESAGADGRKGEPAAKAAGKPSPPPAWQHPDYHGVLSGEQAAWRVANLKPAAEVRRK
ncbi:MAG TPA: hypothetical protein VFH59_07755 [Frateuria sp.]|uniref:hypothetical protein n=1 Tax=Frateuria sp. TaxID=2211372 RepID=UPI002D7E6904|nr:hypothetical protein [Frateuria sp.]HET6805316.1 hypothetical protein [Frateuria sp.]